MAGNKYMGINILNPGLLSQGGADALGLIVSGEGSEVYNVGDRKSAQVSLVNGDLVMVNQKGKIVD